MKTLAIEIYENSEGDFNYEIFAKSEDIADDVESLDGGCCTSTIENALTMAYGQAQDLLKRENATKCVMCGGIYKPISSSDIRCSICDRD